MFLVNASNEIFPDETSTLFYPRETTGFYIKRGSITLSTVITSVFLVVVIVLTIIGNALVMAAVYKDRTIRQNAANLLVASLALADLMVATLVMPLAALYDIRGLWVLGSAACDLFVYMDVLCCTSSILHLVAISLDRYWAVKCVNYVRNRPVKRIILLVVISWVVSAIISSPRLFGLKDEVEVPRREKHSLTYFSRVESPDDEITTSTLSSSDENLSEEFSIVNSTPNDNRNTSRIKMDIVCIISQDLSYTIFSTVGAFYLPLTIMLIIYLNIYRAAKNRIRKKNFASKETSTVDNQSTRLIECKSKGHLAEISRAATVAASRTSVAETSEEEESSFAIDLQEQNQTKKSCLTSSRNEDEMVSISVHSSCVSLSPVGDNSKNKTIINKNSSRILKLIPAMFSRRTKRENKKVNMQMKNRNLRRSDWKYVSGEHSNMANRNSRHPTDHKRLFKLPQDARKCINGRDNGLPEPEFLSHKKTEIGDSYFVDCNFSTFPKSENIFSKTAFCINEASKFENCCGFVSQPSTTMTPSLSNPNITPSAHKFNKPPTPIISISYDHDIDNSVQDKSITELINCQNFNQSIDKKEFVFLDLCIESTVLDISENSSLDEPEERSTDARRVNLKIAPRSIYFTTSNGSQSPTERANKKLFTADGKHQSTKASKASHQKICYKDIIQKRETKVPEKISSSNERVLARSYSKQDDKSSKHKPPLPLANQFITNLAKPSTLLLGVGYHAGFAKRHSAIASSKSTSALFGSMLDIGRLQELQTRKISFCNLPTKNNLFSKLNTETRFNGKFFSQPFLQKSPLQSRLHFQPPKPRKTPEEKAREKREVKRERKAARTLGIITGSFVVCWLPFFTLALLKPFSTTVAKTPQIIVSLAGWLGYLNSLLNPIIYTLFNPDFRLAFATMILGRCMDKRKIIGKVNRRRLPKFSVRKKPLVKR